MKLKTEGFACVYWIHKPDQKDEYNEGYIGVSKNPNKRWIQHRTDAANNRHPNNYLQNAIIKYKDSLVYEVIFGGTEQQCFEYEKELRPKPSIGWNLMSGGPIGKITEEGRKKVSLAAKNRKPKPPTLKQKWQRFLKKNNKYYSDMSIEEYKICIEDTGYNIKTDWVEIDELLDNYRETCRELDRKDGLISRYGNRKILHKLDGHIFYFKDFPDEYILQDCLAEDSKNTHWKFIK